MQTDIMPPRQEINNANRQTMRSLRLRDQSADGARERLSSMRNFSNDDGSSGSTAPVVKPMSASGGKPPSQKKSRFWHGWSKRKKILVFGLGLVLMAGLIFLSYTLFFKAEEKQPEKVVVKVQQPPPPPTTIPSPLSGVEVPKELAERPATAIMIENSVDARPQSGLSDAGVVFEAIAEGGITRFVTLFQDTKPQYVGPVRSLRPYYIDFAAPFDAGIAHVGGSPDALGQIRRGDAKDLDQFFNAGAYWRVSSRRAPHNVYTSFEKLDALNKSKDFTSKYTSLKRKAESKLATPTAKTIDVSISSALYNSHYDYDPATNAYARSQGGQPHISTTSEADKAGAQLRPKVVVALVFPYSTSGKYSVYNVSGSGAVYVFQDGNVFQGTWTKTDRKGQFSFKNPEGQEIALNPGQTWMVALSSADKVKFAP